MRMNKITFRQLAISTLGWFVACVVVALVSHAAYAQGTPNKLESIDVQNLSGQQLQLTLHHSAPPAEPVAFTIDNPARISLDLANTALALPSRRIDVRSGGVDSVLAAEAAGRTRLVLNLDRLLPYTTRVSGNDVILLIGGASASPAVAAAASSGAAGSPVARSSASAAPTGPRAESRPPAAVHHARIRQRRHPPHRWYECVAVCCRCRVLGRCGIAGCPYQ